MKYPIEFHHWLRTVFVVVSCCVLIGCSDATIHKKNLTREEALSFFNEPLPASARNIYCYLKAEGMQGLTRFARFDLDPSELDFAVEAIIAHNKTYLARKHAFERKELPNSDSIPRMTELDWWDPEHIHRGYYRGEIQSFAVRLWVDEERSRIYLFQLD